MMICKLFINISQQFYYFIFNREQLRRQAKFKGLTTCLIRDAGM